MINYNPYDPRRPTPRPGPSGGWLPPANTSPAPRTPVGTGYDGMASGPQIGDLYNPGGGLGGATADSARGGRNYEHVLHDSNPVKYGGSSSPIATTRAPQTSHRDLIGGGLGSLAGQMGQGNAGAILGSSVGSPSFYGGGLAPASGLGGGLYPSLVSLYR